ncbi:phosphoglycerate dehydrogenase [Salinisphaera sp. USBA-960]|uniref:phosphoglycerate dehydrogenase n=1 Tax=Salinisphaera orenii TaxID=856731 RepID=UPI000DBE392B|nr:phosphoglycerate dehydrogenase [Salifodinibacter halophilus]NNC26391.1 phosphoglycerate dehydrogenase [Salifodinibacter halophilus]
MTFKIQTLNSISTRGLERLPRERYEVASDIGEPDALIVRSANLHDTEFGDSIKAIGRAGAGVNNIPVDALTRRGVPVFNAPGANANAVKELVLTGMLAVSRHIIDAWCYVESLEETGNDLKKKVEAGKKEFKGTELPGRKLGVIGLGAVGVNISNAAHALGMKVQGFDPGITINNAWRLHADVDEALSADSLFAGSDFVTLHVPLVEATENLVNSKRLASMQPNSVLLNFARSEIVDEDAVLDALDNGNLRYYICDFPSEKLRGHSKVIALPHLGASTDEAEDNSAIMVADELSEYLEYGHIRNSVNFPEAVMPPNPGAHRVAVVNDNVPNMVGQITSILANRGYNIADLLNKSKGEIAYTLLDVDPAIENGVLDELQAIDGVLRVSYLGSFGDRV